MPAHPLTRRRTACTALLVAVLSTTTAGVAVTSSSAAGSGPAATTTVAPGSSASLTTNVVPKSPAGLTSAIEAYQPYVGQRVCDPSAKPGVVAFRDLLLRTYPASGSLGIVRDCGSGGQSEHKEGRAFDWANNAFDPVDAANVNALLSWLTRTDAYGNPSAMVRRTGLMYVIWNKRIWKSYQASRGWQPYAGASPHTDHVHFSFGWAGARKATSYWSGGKVAGIDYGPGGAPAPAVPEVTVSADRGNIAVQRLYGEMTLAAGQSQDAGAVTTVQRKVLASPVDGIYGSGTAAAVKRAQAGVELPATGVFTPADWDAFFPLPVDPFGNLNSVSTVPGGVRVVGAVVDNDTPDPVKITVTTQDGRVAIATADLPRADVAKAYPDSGANHGFDVTLNLPDGTQKVCVNGINAAGTPGANASLGCTTVVVNHSPQGTFDGARQELGATVVSGWAVDTDTKDPTTIDVLVNGRVHAKAVPADLPRAEASAKFAAFGDRFGFRRAMDLAEGRHTVCAYAKNVGAGRSTKLGCSVITVNRSAAGRFETLQTVPSPTYPGAGPMVIGGWAYDRDTTSPVTVRIRVDGVVRRHVTAAFDRPDVGARLPGYGSAHGFVTSANLPAGVHEVCVEALNAGARGRSADLGCKKVTIGSTIGSLERVATAPGRIAVVGWSLDPDSAARVDNGILVDGVRVGVVRTGAPRPDLTAIAPYYGADRGFARTVAVRPGRHTVCVTAYNLARTLGASSRIGCKVVTVR